MRKGRMGKKEKKIIETKEKKVKNEQKGKESMGKDGKRIKRIYKEREITKEKEWKEEKIRPQGQTHAVVCAATSSRVL